MRRNFHYLILKSPSKLEVCQNGKKLKKWHDAKQKIPGTQKNNPNKKSVNLLGSHLWSILIFKRKDWWVIKVTLKDWRTTYGHSSYHIFILEIWKWKFDLVQYDRGTWKRLKKQDILALSSPIEWLDHHSATLRIGPFSAWPSMARISMFQS